MPRSPPPFRPMNLKNSVFRAYYFHFSSSKPSLFLCFVSYGDFNPHRGNIKVQRLKENSSILTFPYMENVTNHSIQASDEWLNSTPQLIYLIFHQAFLPFFLPPLIVYYSLTSVHLQCQPLCIYTYSSHSVICPANNSLVYHYYA